MHVMCRIMRVRTTHVAHGPSFTAFELTCDATSNNLNILSYRLSQKNTWESVIVNRLEQECPLPNVHSVHWHAVTIRVPARAWAGLSILSAC